METIKLVIWDLDDTFWSGTLSDGEITLIPENIELIKKLTDKGIVNSICSKNDFEQAKAKLKEIDVWDYFVFPSIDWTPKGERVKNIISNMNLRSVNCLFVDDNTNNLEEVKFSAAGINVTLPDKLSKLVTDSAFEGKDDHENSRLKQYKILEKKTAAKAQSGSNEEFLSQSEIRVELIKDCSDKLTRIYEMIHRNNQLNFTKDRISQEEVNNLFTDPDINCGVVHVADKYGDHGIIGCYAIKNGKAVQFVFSCRILGMGVEQWVYAELGYPNIDIVGDVAAQLNKTDRPTWINRVQSKNDINTARLNKHDTPGLIAYGACPLRPISAYLDSNLTNFKFAEIVPTPCCLNLAVTLRASEEQKQYLMSKVNPINNVYTFDKEIYDPKTGYILITLLSIELMYKYKSKTSDLYFFSMPLNEENTYPSFFDEYEPFKITSDDIINELSYICEHLSGDTKLLILTAPEVEFAEIGKDNSYFFRKELNKITEQLAEKYDCIHMVDMRKYAVLPTDFFDPMPVHYNRNIALFLANDILEYMGVISPENTKENQTQSAHIPDNAITQEFNIPESDEVCKVVSFVRNGEFFANVELSNSQKYAMQYTVICNRHNEYTSELTTECEFKFNISGVGAWGIKIALYNVETNIKIIDFSTTPINYNKYNYIKYVDPKTENYDNVISSFDSFISQNAFNDNFYMNIVNQVAELAAIGVNIFDFFLEKGVDEISIVIDERVGRLILPFLNNSKIKIRYLFTADKVWRLKSENASYPVKDINGSLPLSDNDNVFFAFDYYKYVAVKVAVSKTKAKIFSITYALSWLMTKYFFVNRFKDKIPKIIAVRTANLHRGTAFDFSKLTANEKTLEDAKFINEIDVVGKINNNFNNLPPQLKKISKEELLTVMKFPRSNFEVGTNISKFNDIEGKYVNISQGVRKTVGQPERAVGTIYIFGGPHAFGYGVKDDETIASYLQGMIGLPYRVQNYSNCWHYEYSLALNLIDSMEFKENDIAVFIMSNWQIELFCGVYLHWLRWEAIGKPVIKVDAFPLFEKRDRPDYFLHRYGFTPQCNLEIAKLICNAIYSNIRLF